MTQFLIPIAKIVRVFIAVAVFFIGGCTERNSSLNQPANDALPRAAISFENNTFEAINDLERHEATAIISFKNTSKKTVTLKAVKPSCNCMTVTLDANVYEPGQSGLIVFTNTFEAREGAATKTIVLSSSETPQRQYKIDVMVRFPPRDGIHDIVIDFKRAESLDERKIDIKIGDETDPIDSINVRLDFPLATTAVYTVVPGLYYQLGVKPTNDTASYSLKAFISLHSKKRKLREYVLYINVR
jgi:Protein of unknown function (DUF1573)